MLQVLALVAVVLAEPLLSPEPATSPPGWINAVPGSIAEPSAEPVPHRDAPSPKSLTATDKYRRTLQTCRDQVHANIVKENAESMRDLGAIPRSEDAESSFNGTEGVSRVAACIGLRGYVAQAIGAIKTSLRREGNRSFAAADAYARLAELEGKSGRITDARAHAVLAYHVYMANAPAGVNEPNAEIMHAFRRFGGQRRYAIAREETASHLAAVGPGMSADQIRVYRENGHPDDEETYNAPGYHKVVWWYRSDGIKAYTFVNGRLQSVYSR